MKKTFIAIVILVLCLLSEYSMAAERGEVTIRGFMSQGYLKSDHNNFLADTKDGSFEFNEVGINFRTIVTDRLQMGMQFFSRDLGDVGNDEIIIDWAFADYFWKKWFSFNVGILRAPLGLYNETRDVDMVRTFILLPQSVYAEPNRDSFVSTKGVGVYGKIPMKMMGSLLYQIQTGTSNAKKDSGPAKVFEDTGLYKVTQDLKVSDLIIGSFDWHTPCDGLRLVWTTRDAKTDINGILDNSWVWGVLNGSDFEYSISSYKVNTYSIEYTWNNLIFTSEYYEAENRYELTSTNPWVPTSKDVLESEGYYGSLTYRFNDYVEVGAYRSVYYRDKNDKHGTGTLFKQLGYPQFKAKLKDTCLTFRFDINEYWVLKLETHKMDGVGLSFVTENRDDQGNLDYEEDWYLHAIKVTYSF